MASVYTKNLTITMLTSEYTDLAWESKMQKKTPEELVLLLIRSYLDEMSAQREKERG